MKTSSPAAALTAEAITTAALALAPESRAALAEALLDSLAPAGGIKYWTEWEREIEDRIDALDRGEMKTVSREEVMRSLGKPPP
jgi:putative addiction module component (TIGR02574 family)